MTRDETSGTQVHPRWHDRLTFAVNIGVIAFALFLLVRPSGIIGTKLREFERTRAQRAVLAEQWSALAQGSSRPSDAQGRTAIVVFSDYQCPACQNAHERMQTIADELNVAFVYRHFPLPMHPQARDAAKVAICAEEQGRFGAMHDALFEDVDWEAPVDWVGLASSVGVADTLGFARCLDAPSTKERLNQDIQFAQLLDVRATPTYAASERVLVGALSLEQVQDMLQ